MSPIQYFVFVLLFIASGFVIYSYYLLWRKTRWKCHHGSTGVDDDLCLKDGCDDYFRIGNSNKPVETYKPYCGIIDPEGIFMEED